MNKFIWDFLYTLLCNSFLSMKILPKFDKQTKPIRNTGWGSGLEKNTIRFFWTCGSLLDSGYPKYLECFVYIMYIWVIHICSQYKNIIVNFGLAFFVIVSGFG